MGHFTEIGFLKDWRVIHIARKSTDALILIGAFVANARALDLRTLFAIASSSMIKDRVQGLGAASAY